MAATPAEYFSELPSKVNKDKVKGMNAVYQWDITGSNGGKWHVILKNDDVMIGSGQAESPNITLTLEEQNFMDLVTGKLNGQMAFLTGKLKIQGDMTLAMKLQSIIG
jgi:putative sterol carrier protein